MLTSKYGKLVVVSIVLSGVIFNSKLREVSFDKLEMLAVCISGVASNGKSEELSPGTLEVVSDIK